MIREVGEEWNSLRGTKRNVGDLRLEGWRRGMAGGGRGRIGQMGRMGGEAGEDVRAVLLLGEGKG